MIDPKQREVVKDEIFGLIEDEYARQILIQTYKSPHTASALSEACNASEATIYRRIEQLRKHDLIEGVQQLDPDGHHYEEFVARLDKITIELTQDGFEIQVDRTDTNAADRFTDLYEELSK